MLILLAFRIYICRLYDLCVLSAHLVRWEEGREAREVAAREAAAKEASAKVARYVFSKSGEFYYLQK